MALSTASQSTTQTQVVEGFEGTIAWMVAVAHSDTLFVAAEHNRMSALRRTVLLAAVVEWLGRSALVAASPRLVARWTDYPVGLGPVQARGVLISIDASDSIPPVFGEMARVARWDVLRVGPISAGDFESADSRAFVRAQVNRLRETYKFVVVSGVGAGASMSLAVANVPGIDAIVALAPVLAGEVPARLEQATARRLAIVNLEDQGEASFVRLRQSLGRTGASFLLVDRPKDLEGSQAASSGRFMRRFRDDLLWLVQTPDLAPGEVPRPAPSGYALGAEIDFPEIEGKFPNPPAGANPIFAPFWGRWEGDSEDGTYLILRTVGASRTSLEFRLGISDGVVRRGDPRVYDNIVFHADGSGRRLYYRASPNSDSIFMLKLMADGTLEYSRTGGRQGWPREFSARLERVG